MEAQKQSQSLSLTLSKRLAQVCRDPGPTGAQAAHRILKLSGDTYNPVRLPAPHVPLKAYDMDEPEDEGCVQMLDHLPEEEAFYYSKEENVIVTEGTSHTLFKELEAHYGFVGGSEEEYVSYHRRCLSMPSRLWRFSASACAVAGLSALQKSNMLQRKLLMAVATNYYFEDIRKKRALGNTNTQ